EKLGLEPTTQKAIDIATADESKSLASWIERLKSENIEITEENIFIAAACQDKGIAFLKGKGELMVRKLSDMKKEEEAKIAAQAPQGVRKMSGSYTVVVDGQKYSVQVAEGNVDIQVTAVNGESAAPAAPAPQVAPAAQVVAGNQVKALLPGNVWKVQVNVGQSVKEGDVLMILESMKMEIDVVSPFSGVVKSLEVAPNDRVTEGQLVAVIG
ncbi:MAG: biotin/lipoyl-containing protein, partial [Sulfurimonas sp.]